MVFIILSASSVASESEEVTNSIMWRPVGRHHYILAKVSSQVLAVLALYLLFTVVVGYLIDRYHPESDLAVAGITYGVLTVGMLLVTLVTLGVSVSTLLNNTVMAVVVVALVWLGLGVLFSILEISFLSPASLLENLPRVVAGKFSTAEQWKILGSFASMAVLFSALAVVTFTRKDL